ncbi:MAG: peptidylprolyl isomerase [Myxococcaceae bacterium]
MKVGKGSVVGLEYRLHLGDGKVIDESGEQPLSYLHGQGQIVPGLERELEGMGLGDSKQVVVSPAEGYGNHDPAGVQAVPRTAFPPNAEIQPGTQFAARAPDGSQVPVTVRDVQGEQVTIDVNHPLAGKTLHFDVKVTSVRQATQEELSHGHAHGPGGAH